MLFSETAITDQLIPFKNSLKRAPINLIEHVNGRYIDEE